MQTFISHWTRQLLSMSLVLALGCMATLAQALPGPKDIESAVSAGRLSQAESMLREVIQEKPQSAKAHYELGQVLARQSRYGDAQQALVKAKELDPSLKFAASPEKFNDTFNKIAQQAQGLTGAQVGSGLNATSPSGHARAAAPVPPAAPDAPFPVQYVLIGIGALLALALVMRRRAPAPNSARSMAATSPMQSPGYAAPGGAMAPSHGANPYPGQPTGGGMGSGIGGAVVGGLAGVAAGYALSKALEGDHHSNSPQPSSNSGYVPFDAPAAPDLGGFDAGSGSDWDDGSSAGDDSW